MHKKAPTRRGLFLSPIGHIRCLSAITITTGLGMMMKIKNRPKAAMFFSMILDMRSQYFSRAKPKIKATRGINAHVALGNQNCMHDPIVMSKYADPIFFPYQDMDMITSLINALNPSLRDIG